MNGDERIPVSFSVARRFGAGLNLLITLAAVAAIIGMVNYLGMRHFFRFAPGRKAETELSPRTQQVLSSMTNGIKVITYFDSHDALFPRVRTLLKEYEDLSGGKITVQHIDYIRQAAVASAARSTYDLPEGDRNLIVFVGLRKKIVNAADLSDYDTSALMAGKSSEVRRTHFKGEQAFTAAIYEVMTARSPRAYFLIGQEEHSPADNQNQGYSKFASLLQNENNFVCQILDLIGQKEVPADCSLLIIAGPVLAIGENQLEQISRYLDKGGRLLVLFSYRSLENSRTAGLEKLLAGWGIQVDHNNILDAENSNNADGLDPLPPTPGTHPIVSSLGKSRVHFVLPRSIHALRSAGNRREDIKVDELLFTGPKSKSRPDIRSSVATLAGPQPLAAAVEKSIPGLERGSTRIVVVGDSSLWSNQVIDYDANREFAATTVNWLVQQNVFFSEIQRRAIEGYKLTLTQKQLSTVRLFLLLVMPAVVLVIGSLVWLRRRR